MPSVAASDDNIFGDTSDSLVAIEALGEFVRAMNSFMPIRHACFRYWRHWTPTSDSTLEIANYPRQTPNEWKGIRDLRRNSLSQLSFERILPINWLVEIEKATDFGQLLSHSLGHEHLSTGFTIIVRGPTGGAGLFIGDCEHDSNTWTEEFERVEGAIQLLVQSLYLAIERVIKAPPEFLTPREKECLELAAHGKTVKQIARQLELSDQTVTFYLSRVRMKLGVSNTTEAVAKAVKGGFL